MKQDGGMRVVEFVFTQLSFVCESDKIIVLINFCLSGELAHHTYATVAQVVRASASYSEGQWFKSTLWHHKQKFDF